MKYCFSAAITLCCPAALLLAAGGVWNSPSAAWTRDDAIQILTNSPWSKGVQASVLDLGSETARRDGGMMGEPHGVGYDGIEPKRKLLQTAGSPAPKAIPLLIRWENALPIRVAELKSMQTSAPVTYQNGYSVAIYGLPGTYFGDPKKMSKQLSASAALEQDPGQPVRPAEAEVYQMQEGVAIVYHFDPSVRIAETSKLVRFSARVGRLQLVSDFQPADMYFNGKLTF